MSAYASPTEQLPTFNSGDFISSSSSITLSQANSLYARLSGSNIMTGLNTFSSAVSIMGVNFSSNASSLFTNIFIGSTSNPSGQNNICIGQGTASILTTGQYNIVNGFGSLSSVTTGSNNTSIGYLSGVNLTTSSSGNVNIGQSSSGSGICSSCTAIGFNSNANNVNSVAIGTGAIANNLNSIAIGSSSLTSFDNSVAIGSGAVSSVANQIVLGTTNETTQILGALSVVKLASFTLPISLPTSYTSIPNTSQGYNIAANGTPLSIAVQNTYYNIQDIIIPSVGVWAIYYEFVLSAVTAGTISYINTAACSTSAANTFLVTSGRRQVHTPSAYSINDNEQWSQVFYYQTSAVNTHVYLNAYLSFLTGSYTISSKSNIVRIA